jgi:hypothetical protein
MEQVPATAVRVIVSVVTGAARSPADVQHDDGKGNDPGL